MAVVVICGPPGSGKSFFSTAVCSLYPGWVRVNQDTLGSRGACIAAAQKALRNGSKVLIDRCNFDKSQRAPWLDIAKHFQVPCSALTLKVPPETCRLRITNRQEHPTGVMGARGVCIYNSFAKDFRPPEQREGFHKVYTVNITTDLAWTRSVLDVVFSRLGIEPVDGTAVVMTAQAAYP